jgi:hypothetical protein
MDGNVREFDNKCELMYLLRKALCFSECRSDPEGNVGIFCKGVLGGFAQLPKFVSYLGISACRFVALLRL